MAQATNKKESAIYVRISDDEKAELYATAKRLDVPFSQIAREAIREKVAHLNKAKRATA